MLVSNNNTASAAAIKCVKQNYVANDDILSLLEGQRCMVNECIRIGLEENVTSINSLSIKAYPRLREYDNIPSYYRLTAITRAVGILKNCRKVVKEKPWARVPYVRKPSLTDCYGFKIFGMLMRLTFRAGQYLFIILNNHTLRSISQQKVKSVTLTPTSLSIAYSRQVERIEPKGFIWIDTNMGNVTIATTDGGEVRRLDLGDPMKIKEVYREIKSHFKRNDRRIRKNIYSKYGRRERNRVKNKIHQATKKIVEFARENHLAIFMEDLKGIRKMGRRGNFQGRRRRFRLNSWSDREYQSQQEYKARWEGVQVFYVDPWGTSSECSMCGRR